MEAEEDEEQFLKDGENLPSLFLHELDCLGILNCPEHMSSRASTLKHLRKQRNDIYRLYLAKLIERWKIKQENELQTQENENITEFDSISESLLQSIKEREAEFKSCFLQYQILIHEEKMSSLAELFSTNLKRSSIQSTYIATYDSIVSSDSKYVQEVVSVYESLDIKEIESQEEQTQPEQCEPEQCEPKQPQEEQSQNNDETVDKNVKEEVKENRIILQNIIGEICPMFLRFWYSERQTNVTELTDLFDLVVHVSAGITKSFHEAAKDYCERHFSSSEVYRFPPILSKDDYEETEPDCNENADDINEIFNEEFIVTNSLQEVDKFAKLLEGWVQKRNYSAFIFTDFKFKNYLETGKFDIGRRGKGDNEILAIIEQVGVIVVQIRCCSKETKEGTLCHVIRKAFSQSCKDKMLFHECNHDLSYVDAQLPIYGLVGLPLLDEVVLSKLNVCSHHRRMIMTESAMNYIAFEDRLDSIILQSPNKPAFTHQHYKELCTRYVALASSVKTPTYSKSIRLKPHIALLTPQQKLVIDRCDHLHVISGDYGTGKTLILASKAQQVASADPSCSVHIITCAGIDNDLDCNVRDDHQALTHMRMFFTDITANNININCYGSLFDHSKDDEYIPADPMHFVHIISKLFRTEDTVHHVFLDEIPLPLLDPSHGVLELVSSQMQQTSYLWVAIASHSYKINLRNKQNPELVQDRVPISFACTYLNKVMRVPRNVLKMIKLVNSITGVGHHTYSQSGHTHNGPVPILYSVPPCICRQFFDHPLLCDCVSRRIQTTLRTVLAEIGQSFKRRDIVLMIHVSTMGTVYDSLYHVLNLSFHSFGIPLKWCTRWHDFLEVESDDLTESTNHGKFLTQCTNNSSNKDTILVVNDITYIGCENQVVIGIDPFGMHQWCPGGWSTLPLTRCVSQYIHIAWSKNEARAMWLVEMSENSLNVQESEDMSDDEKARMLEEIAQYKKSKGECLDHLLEEHLMEECTVHFDRFDDVNGISQDKFITL